MEDSIKNFIQVCFGIEKIEENTSIDVSSYNIGVESYNLINNMIEFKRVNKVIRKKDWYTYNINTISNSVRVTNEHRFFVKLDKDPFYCTVEDLFSIKQKCFLLNNKKEWVEILKISKNKDKEEIYDLEIEGNHNLFTNNLLSHNSMGGDLNVSTGGNSWKFYADMRLKVWKMLDKPNESNKTTIDIIKNKCDKPFGKAEFNIIWGEGIDTYGEIIEMAVEKDIIKRSGSWYSYGEDKIGQGSNQVKELFKTNNELFIEIKNKVLNPQNNDDNA